MKNTFEKSKNLTNKKERSIKSLDANKLLEGGEKSAEIDLTNLEKGTDDFTLRQKKLLGITENDLKIESEISTIKEKYKAEKQKVKSSFLARLKTIAKYTAGGAIALAFAAHFTQKEYPDYIDTSKEKETNKIEWNESTEKEIKKLGHEYALLIKEDSVYGGVPDSVFENRFTNFVAEYGPDIEVIHPGDDMNLGDRVGEYVFQNILNQPDHRAHYSNGTLFYEEKNLKIKEDSTEYDMETTSLGNFAAEFSHHINKDWELQRSFAYAEDLVRKGFRQEKMYEDIFSSEYQAHSVTDNAIYRYLFPDNANLDIDFVNLYNMEHEYYREFIKMGGYEKSEDIEDLTLNLLMNKKTEDIIKDKGVIFQNLEKIRSILDTLEVSSDLKGNLFSMMTNNFPLENSNNDYQSIIEKAQDIDEILESKKLAFNDPKHFNLFANTLDEKYRADTDYTYVSLTKRIFDDDMIEKMKSNLKNDQTDRLYKLFIYGLNKAIEGSALGHKNANNYPVQWAYEQYESYLRTIKKNIKKEMKKEIEEGLKKNEDLDKDLADVLDKLDSMEIIKHLSYALDYYVNNEVEGLNDLVKKHKELPNSSEEIEAIMVKLEKGFKEGGTPNLERDFFDNGQSPLLKILE